MPTNEFAMIDAFFKSLAERAGGMPPDLGIGDDCALVTVPHGKQLAITTDTLIDGVHFPRESFPFDIGYKSLAVNLSDLAAMGARPAWYSLSLSLPAFSTNWITRFCEGLETMMGEQPISLIGGDTTRGPLSITIQAMGLVDSGCALRRKGAQVGDDIYVSGKIGEAGAGLRLIQEKIKPENDAQQAAVERLNRPLPRNDLGIAISSVATACIDVSDGLLADLGHLLGKSNAGADIDINKVPLAAVLADPREVVKLDLPDLSPLGVRRFAASAGDDYELCFTAPSNARMQISALAQRAGVEVTRIGTVTREPGIFDCAGGGVMVTPMGYSHF